MYYLYRKQVRDMGKYLHKYNTFSEFDEAYNGENYLEPWVSYTLKDEGVLSFKAWCSATSHNYGAEYVGEDEGFYKWHSFQIEDDAPAWDYYWTTSRNPQYGENVYCSKQGIHDNYPCASVGDIIDKGNRVDYNKRKGNWILIGTNGDSEYIIEATTDFVPGSNGATYIFRYEGEAGGPYEDVYVVGETLIPDLDVPFDGTWAYLDNYNGLYIRHLNDCYYVYFNGDSGKNEIGCQCM